MQAMSADFWRVSAGAPDSQPEALVFHQKWLIFNQLLRFFFFVGLLKFFNVLSEAF